MKIAAAESITFLDRGRPLLRSFVLSMNWLMAPSAIHHRYQSIVVVNDIAISAWFSLKKKKEIFSLCKKNKQN